MADGGHVVWPVSRSEAAQVLVEDDIERPMQAVLDVPVLSDRASEQFGVERERAEVEAPLAAELSVPLDAGFHSGDGFEAGKARLSGEAPVGVEESDIVADGVAAPLDAAMIAVDGVVDEQARGWWRDR